MVPRTVRCCVDGHCSDGRNADRLEGLLGSYLRKDTKMLKAIIFFVAALISLQAVAELKVTSPADACGLLAGSDLKGRKWVDYGDGTAGCASNYKDIGSGRPLANNLAFYATGMGQSVKQVKLVMNANSPASASLAIKQLSQASASLSTKLLGAPLPANIKAAIDKGIPKSAVVGSGSVEVVKDVWPTGRGYEIQVIIK